MDYFRRFLENLETIARNTGGEGSGIEIKSGTSDNLLKVESDGSINVNADIEVTDVEIGAVEIKDHDSDDRVSAKVLTGSIDEADFGLYTKSKSFLADDPGAILTFIKQSGLLPEIMQPFNGLNLLYENSVPQTIMGAFKGYIDSFYGLTINNGNQYWLLIPTWFCKRITGYIIHSNALANLNFYVREADYPINPSTVPGNYFADPNNQTALDATNQQLPIDIEPKTEYVLLIIDNNTGGPVTLSFCWEYGVN